MSKHRRSHRSSGGRLRDAVALPVILVAMSAASGCQSSGWFTSRSGGLSPAEQAQVGALAWQDWRNTHEPVEDEQQLEVVRRVGQRLSAASGRTDLHWEFDVVVDPTPQVVAFPGGRVVVSDTLLSQCENEGLLAAAMSHEMGHLLGGHGLERLRNRELPAQNGNSQPPLPAAAFGLSGAAQSWPYSPRHEAEADSIALSLMVGAGYDPEAAHTLWTRLAARQSSSDSQDVAHLHNVNGDRLKSLETSLIQARIMYRSVSSPIGVGQALAFERRPAPPPEPRALAHETPVPMRPVRSAPSLWTATVDRGAAKPDAWNSDLRMPDPAPFTADERGPELPAERPIRQAEFVTPADEEWLTPIIHQAGS